MLFLQRENKWKIEAYCGEFPEQYNTQEQYLDHIEKNFVGENTDIKVTCEGDPIEEEHTNNTSYLKVGLLFILGLLF